MCGSALSGTWTEHDLCWEGSVKEVLITPVVSLLELLKHLRLHWALLLEDTLMELHEFLEWERLSHTSWRKDRLRRTNQGSDEGFRSLLHILNRRS